MLPCKIIIRSPGRRPHEVDGFVPFDGSPLAVTPVHRWDLRTGLCEPCPQNGWMITHVPTGFHVGDLEWDTRDDAMATLLRADPAFPAWQVVTLEENSARVACRVKFRGATQHG